LSKDIILVAALDKIEIWDSTKYKKLFDEMAPEDFSKLAALVMADKPVINL
jgi:MraZ protein